MTAVGGSTTIALLSTSISLRTASSSVRVCRGPFHVDFVDVGVGVGRVEVPAPNPGVPQVDPEDRAAEDLQPVQEDYGGGLSNAQVPLPRVQGLRHENPKHGPGNPHPNQRHSKSRLHAGRLERSAFEAAGARPFPGAAENALHTGPADAPDQRLPV